MPVNVHAPVIITSAKEVLFSCQFVCLFCLFFVPLSHYRLVLVLFIDIVEIFINSRQRAKFTMAPWPGAPPFLS